MSASPASLAEVDWVELAEALRRFSAATGLCTCAYDHDAVRRIGPLFSSRVPALLARSGAWGDAGAATGIETMLAARAIAEGGLVRHLVEDELQVLARPIRIGAHTRGAIVFGWVFGRFSTALGCSRLAKVLEVDPGRLWAEVRLEPPVSESRMLVCSELLETLADALSRHALAMERLHELARVREGFLAFVSHELRTPLSALLARLEVLLRSPLDNPEPVHASLRKMKQHVMEEARLVEDLIEAARTQTGQLHISKQPALLGDIVQRAVDSVRPLAEAKAVRLLAPASDELARVSVLADATRLQQVLWNLLSNGVKFTPPQGSVRITVHCTAERVHLAVADDGGGIDAALLPFIFRPFTKQERGNTQGLGLGLAIAHNIVEQHGGSLTARSEGPGTGSTFHLELPRHPDPCGP